MLIDVQLNSSVLPLYETAVLNKLSENAAKVAYHNFEWRYVTMVVFNTTMFIGIDAFVKAYQKSVIIGKGAFLRDEEKSENLLRLRQFILFGTDLWNIKYMLDWMKRREFDNTGKFIIICQDCDETKSMEIFWNHKITNVVLMKDISDSNNDVLGYTYFVYDDEDCKISQPIILKDPCDNKTCLIMFPTKLKNYHLCQIIVSTFIQKPYMSLSAGKPEGADGDLLVLIGEALNATLKVMTPHRGDGWGTPGPDGNWTGSLGDVYHDLANFSMTSAAITLRRFRLFQMSADYYSLNIVWVTHPAEPQPAWQKLLRPFQMQARITLTVTFLFVVLIACFLESNLWAKLTKTIKYEMPQRGLVFYAWTICMGIPTTTLPSKPAFLYIFLLWVVYCFMIRTFYQASLIHAMKDKTKFPEIENLEDILSSGYPLGGVVTLKDYFNNEPRVFHNWVEINSTDIFPTMVNLSRGMKYVLAMNMATTKAFILERWGDIHIIREPILTSPTVLFFKKFSPMVDSINKILGRLTESGFTDKLYKNHAAATVVKKVEGDVPMNIGHYLGCYVILATGWVVSALSFVLEIFWSNYTMYRDLDRKL